MDDHTRVIYAALKRLRHFRERRDDDFTQDVMAIVLERFSRTYDPTRAKVTTYLYLLTWSAVWEVRRLRKLRHARMPTVCLGDTDVIAPQRSPDIDNKDRLEHALQSLSPKCKQAVTLVFYESCTYKEAGKIMGKSRQRVQQLVSKGILSMRVTLTARQQRERKEHANDV